MAREKRMFIDLWRKMRVFNRQIVGECYTQESYQTVENIVESCGYLVFCPGACRTLFRSPGRGAKGYWLIGAKGLCSEKVLAYWSERVLAYYWTTTNLILPLCSAGRS